MIITIIILIIIISPPPLPPVVPIIVVIINISISIIIIIPLCLCMFWNQSVALAARGPPLLLNVLEFTELSQTMTINYSKYSQGVDVMESLNGFSCKRSPSASECSGIGWAFENYYHGLVTTIKGVVIWIF